MAKIRSRLDLQSAMQAEFAWRKKELHALKTAAYLNRNSADRDVFVRSAIALLYAHWEGFIKATGTNYLEFVARQRLAHGDLAPNFLAMAAARVIHDATSSQKARLRIAVVEFFQSAMGSRSQLKWRGGINTKANLNSAVLAEITMALGLDYSKFETKEKLIDEKLLANRNQIAHGQHMLVDLDEYMGLHDEIFGMMQGFYDQIEAAADNRKFLAARPPGVPPAV